MSSGSARKEVSCNTVLTAVSFKTVLTWLSVDDSDNDLGSARSDFGGKCEQGFFF